MFFSHKYVSNVVERKKDESYDKTCTMCSFNRSNKDSSTITTSSLLLPCFKNQEKITNSSDMKYHVQFRHCPQRIESKNTPLFTLDLLQKHYSHHCHHKQNHRMHRLHLAAFPHTKNKKYS